MSRRHGQRTPEPDIDYDYGYDTGGTPCARGNRCEERDYLGMAKRGPRVLCTTDTLYLRQDIYELPRRYAELRGLLAVAGQAEERVSGSKEPPIPLAADVEAFMREIVHVACDWERAVRTRARLSPYPKGRRRDGVRLADACKTLAGQPDRGGFAGGQFEVLLSLGPCKMLRPATQRRIWEIIAEDEKIIADGGYAPGRIVIDASGQAHERCQPAGKDAALEFFALTGRARGMLGLSLPVRRITEVRCDGCGDKTLVQRGARAGGLEQRVTCRNCPAVYAGSRFDLLMGRVYAAQLAMQEAAEVAALARRTRTGI